MVPAPCTCTSYFVAVGTFAHQALLRGLLGTTCPRLALPVGTCTQHQLLRLGSVARALHYSLVPVSRTQLLCLGPVDHVLHYKLVPVPRTWQLLHYHQLSLDLLGRPLPQLGPFFIAQPMDVHLMA